MALEGPAPYDGHDPDLPSPLWRVGEEIPAPLMLVLPSRLGSAGTLRALVRVLQEIRNDFAQQAQRYGDAYRQAQAKGEHLEQMMLYGITQTSREAAETIDDKLFRRFALFGQMEAAGHPSPESTAWTAEDLGVDIDRPDFPLPEVNATVGRLVGALVGQRVQMVSLAVLERHLAWSWEREAHELGEDPEDCPHFRAHYSRAITWAMAADRIDAALADAFDLTPQYQTFLAMYGPWLGRIA